MLVFPRRLYCILQRQGLDRGAALQQFGQKRVAADTGLALSLGRGLHHPAGNDGHDDKYRKRNQQHPHHRRGDDIDDHHEQHGKGQIGQQHGGGARERIAHHLGIAEQGLPKAGGAAFERAQRQGGDFVVERTPQRDIDSERHPLQHAAARLANDEIEQKRRQDADQQAIKRTDAVTKDDAGIDLQDEYRHRQRQQVDEQRNQNRFAQAGARRLHHRFQPFAAGGFLLVE